MRTTLDRLTSIIPAQRIRACHCNDTSVTRGGRADRHTKIGTGNVALEGFRALLHYEALAHCAFILETPGEAMLECKEKLNTLLTLRRRRPSAPPPPLQPAPTTACTDRAQLSGAAPS